MQYGAAHCGKHFYTTPRMLPCDPIPCPAPLWLSGPLGLGTARAIWSFGPQAGRRGSFPLCHLSWGHSVYFPARQLQSAICPAFFHSQELLLIIPASKGPFPSEPAVGTLSTALSAAERHCLGCSLSFLCSVPRGTDAEKHGLDAWKPSRWFQCLSLSCCRDGERTMVLGSRSQHSDFASFGKTASPCECSEDNAQ